MKINAVIDVSYLFKSSAVILMIIILTIIILFRNITYKWKISTRNIFFLLLYIKRNRIHYLVKKLNIITIKEVQSDSLLLLLQPLCPNWLWPHWKVTRSFLHRCWSAKKWKKKDFSLQMQKTSFFFSSNRSGKIPTDENAFVLPPSRRRLESIIFVRVVRIFFPLSFGKQKETSSGRQFDIFNIILSEGELNPSSLLRSVARGVLCTEAANGEIAKIETRPSRLDIIFENWWLYYYYY